MSVLDKRGRFRKTIKYHYQKQRKGMLNHHFKGNRYKFGNYWALYLPEYFSSTKHGRVYEHIYVFQEYNKCCLLPWGQVHHIDPVREGYCNNMPWNLEGMMKQKHIDLHMKGNQYGKNNTKNMDDRACSFPLCNNPNIKTRWWYNDLNNDWLCHYCYNRIQHYIQKWFNPSSEHRTTLEITLK